ncbi:hypothetical protein 16Q_128 [Pseudomonas phage 16Q]|nr:hypothetical protein 16Q_128 [Pseudomonas phage 16Q]
MWVEVLQYDESVPSCLRWTVSRARQKAGEPAGSDHVKGYMRVRYNYKNYLAHRVVYELCTGETLGDDQVDHRDGDTTNNRIDNLRRITPIGQSQNLRQYKSNTSGVTGVRYVTMGNHEYAQAYWMEQGTKRFFMVRCDRTADAFELCEFVRKEVLDTLNQRGAEYTHRHGKPPTI